MMRIAIAILAAGMLIAALIFWRVGFLRRVRWLLALTACAALLLSSMVRTAGPPIIGSDATAGRSDTAAGADPATQLSALDRDLGVLKAAEEDSPRDRWDPDYVVEMLGRDPQRVIEWVRNQTVWIPYRGVLRGPVGVLLDRQGGSLDRALLLAMLLEKAGQTVRLAHGELTMQQATALLPKLVARRRAYFSDSSIVDGAADPGVTAATGLRKRTLADQGTDGVAAQYRPIIDSVGGSLNLDQGAVDGVAAQIEAQVADQSRRLLRMLPPPDPRQEWLSRYNRAALALRDHWWVQLKQESDWIDEDLLGEGAGRPLATRTLETTSVDELPADLYHQITVRVIAEQWSAHGLAQHRTLEYVLRPSANIAEPLVLQFWPAAWLSESPGAQSPHGLSDIATQDQWIVALTNRRKTLAHGVLLQSGGLPETKGGPLGGLGAAMSSAFSDNKTGSSDSALSAVWVEYEIHVPGKAPRVQRRTIFDWIGASARARSAPVTLKLDQTQKIERGLALMMQTEILAQPCQIPQEYLAHLNAQSVIANRPLLEFAIRGNVTVDRTASPEQQVAALLGNAATPISPLLPLEALRFQGHFAASPAFLDRPNLWTRHRYFAPSTNQIAVLDAVDIVANEVEVDLAETDAFAVRIRQGALDTNMEALAAYAPPIANVAQSFASSGDWIAITPAQVATVNELAASSDARQRMADDLAAGHILVAPSARNSPHAGDALGWWRIDPQTGDALGVSESGWGAAIVEWEDVQGYAADAGSTFIKEFALCMAWGQGINVIRRLNEKAFGGWQPPWTVKVHSRSAGDIASDDAKVCVLQAIAAGALATLPLVAITVKGRLQAMRRIAAEEAIAKAIAADEAVSKALYAGAEAEARAFKAEIEAGTAWPQITPAQAAAQLTEARATRDAAAAAYANAVQTEIAAENTGDRVAIAAARGAANEAYLANRAASSSYQVARALYYDVVG